MSFHIHRDETGLYSQHFSDPLNSGMCSWYIICMYGQEWGNYIHVYIIYTGNPHSCYCLKHIIADTILAKVCKPDDYPYGVYIHNLVCLYAS